MLAEIFFEHMAPGWLVGTTVAAAVALTVFWFIRYPPRHFSTVILAVLRIAFFLLLGWCLLMPLLKQAQSERIRPRFIVALDTSASMTLSPAKEGANRWTRAQEVLALPWTRNLPGDPQIDVYSFAHELGKELTLAEVARLKADGPATHLRAALRKMLDRYKGQTVAGLLLLSDGLDTKENSGDWVGEPWPCPIFAVRLEPSAAWETEPDVRVETVNTPRRVVVGWDTKLTGLVSGQGLQGQMLNVQLVENDKVVQESPLQVPSGGSREIAFHVTHAAVGSYRYTVQVPALNGETHTNDNAFGVTVQVVDPKNRLIYVEGVPRWESKYLIRVLRANRNITALCFLRGPGNRFLTYGERESMTLDFTDEQLARFKIVILGDLDAEALTPPRTQAIAKFVENGGSLVLLGGPAGWGSQGYAATDLRRVLPVQRDGKVPAEQGNFVLKLTDEGLAHPIFTGVTNAWDRIPPVLSLFPGATLAAGSSALLMGQTPGGNQPVLVTQRYGQGKVAVILTDSLWRWQLDPGAGKPYSVLWNQLLQWLSPFETEMAPYELDLFTESDQAFLGEPITLNARLSGTGSGVDKATVVCELEAPDGHRIPLTMNRQNVQTTAGKSLPGYRADYAPEAPGLHRAVAKTQVNGTNIESSAYSFYVRPYTPESNPRPADAVLLQTLCANSAGKFCDPDQIGEALAALPVTSREESRVLFRTLWNTLPILACLVGLLVLDWMVRKSRNLP